MKQEEAALTVLEELLKQLRPKVCEHRMESLQTSRLEALPKLELADIEEQKKMFELFERHRVEAIQSQLDALVRAEKIREIEAKKLELEKKERLYYFFENFPKHEIDFVEAEKRIKEIQSQTVVDEDYIPPEI